MNRRFVVVMVCLFTAAMAFAFGSSGGTGGGGGKLDGKTALDWYNTGYAASQQGHYDEAITDFTNAIQLNESYAEAYNMLGYCTRKLGNVQKAFSYYDTALRLRPNFPEAREYYGEAWL